MKAITKKQQNFIVALMSTDTIEQAANAAGIAQTTAYKYLKDPDVIISMRELRSEVMRQLAGSLSNAGGKAVQTLEEIMGNKKAPAHARVSAARAILEHLYRVYEINDVVSRIDELEKRILIHE